MNQSLITLRKKIQMLKGLEERQTELKARLVFVGIEIDELRREIADYKNRIKVEKHTAASGGDEP